VSYEPETPPAVHAKSGMVQRWVTLRAYEPEARARATPTLACASGSYDRQDESEKCYPDRRAIEPCLKSRVRCVARASPRPVCGRARVCGQPLSTAPRHKPRHGLCPDPYGAAVQSRKGVVQRCRAKGSSDFVARLHSPDARPPRAPIPRRLRDEAQQTAVQLESLEKRDVPSSLGSNASGIGSESSQVTHNSDFVLPSTQVDGISRGQFIQELYHQGGGKPERGPLLPPFDPNQYGTAR
jgi:hypothetical protein